MGITCRVKTDSIIVYIKLNQPIKCVKGSEHSLKQQYLACFCHQNKETETKIQQLYASHPVRLV